jgi:hypothetical protein
MPYAVGAENVAVTLVAPAAALARTAHIDMCRSPAEVEATSVHELPFESVTVKVVLVFGTSPITNANKVLL